jgi:VanZ family protein
MRKLAASFPYWLPVVLWMGVIFFLSSLTESATPGREIVSDKILHAAEYFILAFLILFALQRTTRLNFLPSFLVTLAWGALYGLSDEIHQRFVQTRHCDLLDLMADVGGVVVLFLLLWALRRSGERGAEIYRLLTGREGH